MNQDNLLRKLIIYFPVKIIPAATGFFFIIYLYGNLGPKEYVDYSISVSISVIGAQVSGGWIGNALLFFLPVKTNKKEFVKNGFLFVLTTGVVVAGIGSLISLFLFSAAKVSILILLLCVSQTIFYFCATVLQGAFNSKTQLISVVIQALIQTVVLLFLFNEIEAQLEFALIALIAGFVSGSIIMMPAIHERYPLVINFDSKSNVIEDVKDIVRYGGPMCIWTLSILMISTGDRYIIGILDISRGNSYLSVKDLLLGASGLVSMPLLMLIHPLVFVKFRKTGFPAQLIKKSISILIILFWLFWTVWQIVGVPMFELMSKKSITVSPALIFIIFFGNAVGCVNIYLQKRLEAHHKTMRLAVIAVIVAGVSVIVGIALGAAAGLTGLAIAYLFSQLLYGMAIWGSTKKRLDFIDSILRPNVNGFLYWVIGLALWQLLNLFEVSMSAVYISLTWLLIFGSLSAYVVLKDLKTLLAGE